MADSDANGLVGPDAQDLLEFLRAFSLSRAPRPDRSIRLGPNPVLQEGELAGAVPSHGEGGPRTKLPVIRHASKMGGSPVMVA